MNFELWPLNPGPASVKLQRSNLAARTTDKAGVDINAFGNVKTWFDAISRRPAVVRTYEVGATIRLSNLTDAWRIALFRQSK